MTASKFPESVKAASDHARLDAGNGADAAHTGVENGHETASLLTELRIQREANVALVLEVSGRRTAADLAAKREDVLLGQLDLERSLRRRAEEDLRNNQSLVSALQHQLALSTASTASAQQDVRDIGVQLAASQARTTAQLVKLAEAEARHNALEAEVTAARAVAEDALSEQQRVGDLLAQSEAQANEAISAGLKAEVLNRRLASGLRHVAGHLIESLGVLTTADGAHLSVEGQGEVSPEELNAILAGMTQLRVEREAAAMAIAEAGREALALAARLSAGHLANQELLVELDSERGLSAAQAVQLDRLGRIVSEQTELAESLEARLAERDAMVAGLKADHAAGSARLQQLEAEAKHLAAQLAEANDGIRTEREEFSRRQEEFRSERDRASENARTSASRIAEVERANEALVQAQRKLEQEARDMVGLLEERRQAIRKLQQEMALLKLGRA